MHKRSKGLLILLSVISLLLLSYLLLPHILTTLVSHLTGNEVSVEEVVLTQGYIKGLRVISPDFTFRASETRVIRPLSGLLSRDFDEISLIEPSIYLVALSDADSELGFLKRLPNIRRLNIEHGHVRLTDKGSDYEIVLSGLKVIITNYSPKRGGKMTFNFHFRLAKRVGWDTVASGSVTGNSIIKPYEGDIAFNGDLEISLEGASLGPVSIGQSSAKGGFIYEKGSLYLKGLSIEVSHLKAETDKGKLPLGPLTVTSELFFNSKTKQMRLTNLSGLLRGIGDFMGDLDIVLTEDYGYRSHLTLPKVDIKTLLELFGPLLSDNLRQWNLSGKASVKSAFKGNFQGGQPHLEGEATIKLSEGSFVSQDALKAGQGIAAEFVMDLKYPQSVKKKSIQLGLNTRLSEGEYLWDSFYVNLRDNHMVIDTGLVFPLDKADEIELALKTDLMATGDYRVFVRKALGQWQIKTRFHEVDLKGLQGSVFRDSISILWPLLKGLDVSGYIDMDIDTLLTSMGLLMQGHIEIRDLSLVSPSTELKGLNARLPIMISPSMATSVTSDTMGFVSMQKGRIKDIEFPYIHLPLRSEGNRLRLTEPQRLAFLGGYLNLDALEAVMDLQEELFLRASVRLSEISVAPITEAIGFGPISGRFNSHIPNIKLKGKSISTEGQIDIELFGGRVLVSNIHGQLPFNYIGADIEFHDIDLERLTETIKIGRITGIVKGFIKDLEIQYGQAARFVMEIDSVPVDGVPQLVSTDAVESISILGTGAEGLSKILSSGINQFFKDFPYKRLGLRCTLENDVFTIRGKISEGGKEYIIKRGPFRGIDVVNHNPESTISFREMQTRLKAVLQKDEIR